MATLPRTSKSSPAASSFFQRPQSEFDAGINTSAAWTEHLQVGSDSTPSGSHASLPENSDVQGSLSDDEHDDDDDLQSSQPGRVLYRFSGKPEFRELAVEAGETIDVLKEDVGDGWSLVKTQPAGEMGLLPRTYYTYTSEFHASSEAGPSASNPGHPERDASTSTITPNQSTQTELPPILVPQNTGEWARTFPSFRQSLLGGKSLNRFSSFVTSGAEDWVLKGIPAEPLSTPETAMVECGHLRESTMDSVNQRNRRSLMATSETYHHYVDAGPTWKEKIPPFKVLVHSPEKRTHLLSGAFTVYNVTSLFNIPIFEEDRQDTDDLSQTPLTRITVQRRFSHFVVLHTALTRRLPGIALPPLPEKQYAGRFSDDFVEARRGDLERYINKLVRHPVARYAEIVTFFLGCENDSDWNRFLPQYLSMPPAGPSFYAHVYHPAFNLDAEDAENAVDCFETHTRAVGKGVQGLRSIFGQVREAHIEMSKAERLLSYSLLSLITSKSFSAALAKGVIDEEQILNITSKGLMNQDRAWCWRESCKDCLSLTKAMQKTSESLQSVADLYDDHARRRLLATHEALKITAHPSALYEGVITTHRSTLSRYRLATAGKNPNEDVAARCETVLNITMAEMDTYHAQKIEDFRTITEEHLDGEIILYEQILTRLRNARMCFEDPYYGQLSSSPRQISLYERELDNPRLTPNALLQPCPHVFDSSPMRPVSMAIQDGVGALVSSTVRRGSMFGKLW